MMSADVCVPCSVSTFHEQLSRHHSAQFRYKDGKELPTTDKAKPKKVSSTIYQLEIPDVGKDVAGDYKVTAVCADFKRKVKL